ncbi:MAG: hypothetical protein OXI61_06705 [Candidatus Poribacteria bacterium]|nr:hypothetical protein [Candidatus Poribacteria bacterium]
MEKRIYRVKNLIVMARLITIFKSFENEDDAIAAWLQDLSQDLGRR